MEHVRDILRPITELLDLVQPRQVTGPDFDGVVWLTVRAEGSEDRILRMGHMGEPAADGALRWRSEQAERLGYADPEDDPLRESLHRMDVSGPYGGDVGD